MLITPILNTESVYPMLHTIILNAIYGSHEHIAAVRRMPILRCRTLKAVLGWAIARSLSRPSMAQSINVSNTSKTYTIHIYMVIT